jgi:hypothetical protein
VNLAVRFSDQHKSAAANISGFRINDRQREPDGNRSVYGIPAFLHYLDTDLRRQLVLRGNHCMTPAHWFPPGCRNRPRYWEKR